MPILSDLNRTMGPGDLWLRFDYNRPLTDIVTTPESGESWDRFYATDEFQRRTSAAVGSPCHEAIVVMIGDIPAEGITGITVTIQGTDTANVTIDEFSQRPIEEPTGWTDIGTLTNQFTGALAGTIPSGTILAMGMLPSTASRFIRLTYTVTGTPTAGVIRAGMYMI